MILYFVQMDERYEFFAPIWRVMRDSNMSVEEVKEQVSYVALVTKQASQVSDLRSHSYLCPRVTAPVLYFRGLAPGVCTYFDDRKGPRAPTPHGACWYARCEDLRVVDVPGDHFSLLRQDSEDMTVLVTALKMALGQFGWTETVQREDKPAYAVEAEEIQDIDAYLRKMGVKDSALRQRLEASMPYASSEDVGSALAKKSGEGGAPVVPLNAAAVQLLRDAVSESTTTRQRLSTLVVCCDANGSLGGLDDILSLVDLPAFALRLPTEEELWEHQDMAELATVALKTLQRSLPPSVGTLIMGGVSFGGVLAHEIALQLDATTDRVTVVGLALFEGNYTVVNPGSTLPWLTAEVRYEACQAATALYPAVVAGGGAAAPSLDAFVTRLASINDFDAQLDYVATFKSADEPTEVWDEKIDAVLARLGYYKTLVDTYEPTDILPGESLVFKGSGSVGNDLATGGPAGVWRSIRFLVQPATEHVLAADQPPSQTSAALAEYLRAAVSHRMEVEERASLVSDPARRTLSALTLTSPPSSGAVPSVASPAFSESRNGNFENSPHDTLCLLSPLNRLCPERRYILRRGGRSGTPRQLVAPPLSRIPLWMLHTERGDVGSTQKELASLLPFPCYGLGMGPDADQCSTLEELAVAYTAAVVGMQPSGPYILMGVSLSGCALAHAMAVYMQKEGHRVALVLLDGCVGVPIVPLHDATWYALFYLLREIGSLTGGIGEFVDFVRGAGSPTAQLKLISSFKPPDLGVPAEAWDAAVYATLDRAAALKRLLRSRAESEPTPFDGPAAVVGPRDRLGRAFVQASAGLLRGGGADGMMHVPLESRHTETLLSQPSRAAAALAVTAAVQALLPRLV